jgi:hypothetical protein
MPRSNTLVRVIRFLAGLTVYFVVLLITWHFDPLLAIEAGFLSTWGGMMIFQLNEKAPQGGNFKENRVKLAISYFLIALTGYIIIFMVGFLPHMFLQGSTRMEIASRLREIGIAIHRFNEDHGHVPPVASLSVAGKPLLSWRVHLLPQLGEDELYQRFHLNEPWDSMHNLSLLSLMPKCYQFPRYGRRVPVGMTCFQLIVGPSAFFELGAKRSLANLRNHDGLSNTIVAAVAEHAMPWTKPADLEFNDVQPLLLGSADSHFPQSIFLALRPGSWQPERRGYQVLWGDASIRSVYGNDQLAKLKPFITWNGKEIVVWDD